MGLRFAFAGGRESWVRTALTGVGVGIGVALLLITTAIPTGLGHRHDRERARDDWSISAAHKSDSSLLVADAGTSFHGEDVRGRLLEPEGAHAALPPGVRAMPAPGQMVVSPALADLLKSDGGALLRDRLPYRITGTIEDSGLVGPSELAYYAGADHIKATEHAGSVRRIDSFGSPAQHEAADPILLLLVMIMFVALLMPVGVFLAAAVRFGGEQRDRRLAALRLVGADALMTRRIAAGEALAGSLLGLLVGAGLFFVGRSLAGRAVVIDVSVFPSDLTPVPGLVALVAVAVPLSAIGVTLFAMRRVVIEPLGVVRTAKPPRRRLWWRLLLPLGGLALLYPMVGQSRANPDFNEWMVISGTVLLLVGITALLPWVVETAVSRLGGGGVPWQLAVRRLQVGGGSATRMVNGIAVAVAGAIALQMLFSGVQGDYVRRTGNDVSRAQLSVGLALGTSPEAADAAVRGTEGVARTISVGQTTLTNTDSGKEADAYLQFTVGGCAALREVARIGSCHEGDVFAIDDAPYDQDTEVYARTGATLYTDPGADGVDARATAWKLPEVGTAGTREDPTGNDSRGLLATPSAVPDAVKAMLGPQMYIGLDRSVPDAEEHARNAVAHVDALADVQALDSTEQARSFTSLRTGLLVGAVCVLALIGASLLVSQLEQLRERRRLLSALVAFGTRRRTLGLSVLWQTAIPVALGLLLATGTGLLLGTVLLKMVGATLSVAWSDVARMVGAGAAVVLGVTALALPPLARMLRPDGLRTE
ncbi:FtsX-like permease family protein [Streptomyces sp. NPDC050560]|uniref:FtsX-like permease family protein n=1 Tax=Streptomyces sp. NPDC050560 TaxID=3365630 RepID=UPI0037BCC238